ncbi:hypothetical protein BROUX41_005120 [Berkeleyomyces rouxiae]|uniref:uncharacterized protein n=1 Tax=Berkeleyomyces rouxiae TaxID=2035830 RepID=UPI003B7649FA
MQSSSATRPTRNASPDSQPTTAADKSLAAQTATHSAPLLAKWRNQAIIHGHLIFWSIFGVLARLGMIGLTEYPNAPVSFGVLWANVAGSFVMGFLLEERVLFVETVQTEILGTEEAPVHMAFLTREEVRQEDEAVRREMTEPESGPEPKPKSLPRPGPANTSESRSPESNAHTAHNGEGVDIEDTNLDLMQSLSESEGRAGAPLRGDPVNLVQLADYVKAKKTLPLYIGLATGFCGSFTSFSTFVLDAFLAAVNELPADSQDRARGDSFMAFAAVAVLNPAMSLAGFYCGMHAARGLSHLRIGIHGIPGRVLPGLDIVFALLGYGCWIGAAFMTAWPPHDHWRGKPLFSLIIGPLGTILRFHLAAFNAGRRYPLGTLAANMLGTALLGAFFDVMHVPIHSVVGCQILEGFSDGFCGCLTTVSTWVAELSTLGTRRAYIYGMASFAGGFMILIPVMGGLHWTEGFGTPVC